jgi:hypothetical protein
MVYPGWRPFGMGLPRATIWDPFGVAQLVLRKSGFRGKKWKMMSYLNRLVRRIIE